MKKKTIFSILSLCLIAVLSLSLIGCGKKDEPVESKAEKETTAPAESKAEKETTAPAETTVPGTSDLPTEDRMMQATVNAIYANNEIGRLSASALDKDDSITYDDGNGHIYNYVTDEKFQNFGDISMYLNDNFTWDYVLEKYPYLADPGSYEGVQQYLYLHEDDTEVPGLYMLQAGKGFPVFDPNADISFSNVQPDSFCASFSYDNFGTPSTATFEIVFVDGAWKTNNVTIG